MVVVALLGVVGYFVLVPKPQPVYVPPPSMQNESALKRANIMKMYGNAGPTKGSSDRTGN